MWDGGNIVLEADTVGSTIDTYIRGINLIKSDTNGYYVYNAHGDVVELTDSSGNVAKSYVYDAFGVEKNIDAEDTNPIRYAGEYFDGETGDYYLRNRYYNPIIGRFLTEDPIGAGLNWYTYCNNNPIMFIDPSGLDTDSVGLSLSGALLGRVSVSIQAVKDDEGNVGIMFVLGGGMGSPSVGLDLVGSSSDAFEIMDLNGKGQSGGGNLSSFVYEASTGKDRNGNQVSSESLSYSILSTDTIAGEIHSEINVTGEMSQGRFS